MKTLLLVWILAVAGSASGQENENSAMVKAFLKGRASLDELAFGEGMGSEMLTVELGESVIKHDGGTYDGLVFKVPKNAEGLDFVWYFNAPQEWASWYILALGEEPKQGFRNWLNAEMAFEGFDLAGESGRLRALQTLEADYFEPGKEYVLWFKRMDDTRNRDLRLKAAFVAAGKDDEWSGKGIEKALGLKRQSNAGQIAYLGSLGGKILLDPQFFDAAYAELRIDSLFLSMREQRRMEGGFFMQLKTSVPPCYTNPKLADIIAKHGEPDFVRTGKEESLLRENDKAGDGEEAVVKYYYDYFGFVVDEGDKDRVVRLVEVQANDFSSLRPKTEERATFGRLEFENLTVFHFDGDEVGRVYLFDEGDEEPLVIKAPPVGKYMNGSVTIDFRGDGVWSMEGLSSKGEKIYSKHYRRNLLEGGSEVYHPNGKIRYRLSYRKGLPHGKFTEFDDKGEVVREAVYEDGEPVVE